METVALNTGARMPALGLGTWQLRGSEAGAAVEYALREAGYRHIDCASVYHNEPEIGEAFARTFSLPTGQAGGSVKREEVFITSKLWNSFHARADVAAACKRSLHDLRLDYLDLYLVHWGIADAGENEPLDEHGVLVTKDIPLRETWEAMEELVAAGLVKAIGVSNFTAPMLLDLFSYAKVAPAVNQIELHPYLQQSRLVEFCRAKGIAVTAYSPLGRPEARHGRAVPRLVDDGTIARVAAAHSKTPAQVLLRWGLQRGTAVIPKSAHPARISENAQIFDFALTKGEMRELAGLERGLRFVDPYDWWKLPCFD